MSIIIIPIKVALQRTYLNGMDDLAIVVSCGVFNEFLCAMEDLHMAMDIGTGNTTPLLLFLLQMVHS